MTSNMVVAMRDVVQMCFVGFSIQIEGAAVAESVVLFTHYQAAQLSELLLKHGTVTSSSSGASIAKPDSHTKSKSLALRDNSYEMSLWTKM